MFSIEQFKYSLPAENIAHTPVHPRDTSKLLILDRNTGEIKHAHFFNVVDLLGENDVIVRNNSKVLPARIFGKKDTGGQCEVLLIKNTGMSDRGVIWECLTKPGVKLGQTVTFLGSPLTALCTSIEGYTRKLEFNRMGPEFFSEIDTIGHMPLPPYIRWDEQDEATLRRVYQTTYAKVMGSVAAPTAGLHFTPELDQKLRMKGVQIEEVTLHVGLGTFLPVQDEQIQKRELHQEFYEVSEEVAARLNQAKRDGKHIISVGTTTTRVLESCTQVEDGVATLSPGSGETRLFIQPGYNFRFVDALITNFHLPKSSLLMLISAFVSRPNTQEEFIDFAHSTVGKAYQEAIGQGYRFYSFGDAMMIT